MERTMLHQVNRACANLHAAKMKSWNAFAALNNNALHKQKEVIVMMNCLRTLRTVRDILKKNPEPTREVMRVVQCLKDGIMKSMTDAILELNIAAANDESGTNLTIISRLKHDSELPIINAAKRLKKMFETFDDQPAQ
jgi:hypothetical protein